MRTVTRLILAASCAASCAACSQLGDFAEGDSGASDVTGAMLVANKRGNTLSRVDLATGAETHSQATCENPHELTVSPDQSQVMVACYSGSTVEIYQTADLTPARAVELGADARVHSAFWHDNGRIVAGAEGRGSLFVIGEDGTTEFGSSGAGPHLVAVNDAGTQAWGTIISTGTVIRYDLEAGEEAAQRVLGGQIEALALSPDGQTLWAGSNGDATIFRLNAQTLETQAEISVGDVPIRVAAHPDGAFVVTSNFGGGDLSVIDTATNEVTRTIILSGGQDAEQVTLLFSPDGTRLYVAETADDVIAELDFASGEVLRRLPAGEGGDGLAIID